jgi:Uma2 family endonuclease
MFRPALQNRFCEDNISRRRLRFLAYLAGVPITIVLPDLETQTSFNLARWAEILADPRLATLPDRIESDRYGRIVMTPPPGFVHSDRQGRIIGLLNELLRDGNALPECPLSTADGVKAIDVVWLAKGRAEFRDRPLVLTSAPEICIEVLSPSNRTAELTEKRALYFDAGATEVWICNLDGTMSFFVAPDHQVSTSSLCATFPQVIP